jgi:hypothetical protein
MTAGGPLPDSTPSIERAEILEDGYDVSDILCYSIDRCYTKCSNAVS